MRKFVIIGIILVVLAGAGYLIVRQSQASQAQEVEVIREAEVLRDKITATVNASGSIEPESLVTLSFGVGGTVEEVNVVRGQQVSVGDILASVEADEIALAVQQAQDALRIQELTLQQALNSAPTEATLAGAQADISSAEANLLIAQSNLAAAEASLAQAQAQRAQIVAGPTAGQVAAAESQVTSARNQLKLAQDNYDKVTTCFDVTLPSGEEDEVCPGLGAPEEQARANVENATVALTAAEAQLADLQSGAKPADIQVANAAIAAAQAQVDSAEANIAVAEANIDRAQAAYDRLLEGVSADDLAILEAQVASGETNLAVAQLRLDQSRLIAPIDGRLANVQIKAGEQAAPGAPALSLVNEAAYHLEVSVDEIDIDQVAVGQDVEITLDALPDAVLNGKITEIAPTAATSGLGVVTYLVTINIDSEDVQLRPGLTANASIVVDELDGALIVPNWAIRLDRETGNSFVNRQNPDGTVEEVIVVTGLRNEQFSEVISGLNAGDTVVVTNEREGLSSFFGG